MSRKASLIVAWVNLFLRNPCLGSKYCFSLALWAAFMWCVHLRCGLCLAVPWLTDGMPFNQPGSPLIPGTPAVSSDDKLCPPAAGFSITDDASPSRLYQEDIRCIRPRSASSPTRRDPRCRGRRPLQVLRHSKGKSSQSLSGCRDGNPSERSCFSERHMWRATAGRACRRRATDSAGCDVDAKRCRNE